MSDDLLSKAQRLAERPYHIEIESEQGELSPEVPRYTASVKEIPFCVAQGFTEEEAREEIRSVLVDYILSLLARNVDVPEPEVKFSGCDADYAVQWLWEGCFVYANKSLLEQFASPHKSLRTFMYAH